MIRGSRLYNQEQKQQKQQKQQENYAIPEDGILPGGRLSRFYHNWTRITSHPWPLSIVKEGYRVQFVQLPVPWRNNHQTMEISDQVETDLAVNKFLQAGIIEPSTTPHISKKFLSKFFTLQICQNRCDDGLYCLENHASLSLP
jgi:hypothetical protein